MVGVIVGRIEVRVFEMGGCVRVSWQVGVLRSDFGRASKDWV